MAARWSTDETIGSATSISFCSIKIEEKSLRLRPIVVVVVVVVVDISSEGETRRRRRRRKDQLCKEELFSQ